MTFDPDTHTQTHKLFFFIWPSLQSREHSFSTYILIKYPQFFSLQYTPKASYKLINYQNRIIGHKQTSNKRKRLTRAKYWKAFVTRNVHLSLITFRLKNKYKEISKNETDTWKNLRKTLFCIFHLLVGYCNRLWIIFSTLPN